MTSEIERMILLVTLFSATMFGASPFCAFVVSVHSPSGVPLPNTAVVMLDGDTHSAARTDANGLAKFCDVPLRPVDFAVGYRECGVVFVKGVVLTWPESRDIHVIYDPDHCRYELIPPNSCQLMLRIRNGKGQPLAGARLVGDKSQTDMSDAFGRIFRRIESGESWEGVVEKEGWRQVRISERCVRDNEKDREVSVVMREQGRP